MLSRALIASLITVLAVAGCGSSEPDAKAEEPSHSSTSEVDAGHGDKVSTDEYSYSLPEGWEEPAEQPAGFDFDSVATNPEDEDGFSDNINVIRAGKAPSDDLGEFEDQSVSQLKGLGATEVKVLPRASIDGAESIHITARTSLNEIEYRTNQYGVINDDIVYVVTFSFSEDVTAEDQADVTESVLSTWKWAA